MPKLRWQWFFCLPAFTPWSIYSIIIGSSWTTTHDVRRRWYSRQTISANGMKCISGVWWVCKKNKHGIKFGWWEKCYPSNRSGISFLRQLWHLLLTSHSVVNTHFFLPQLIVPVVTFLVILSVNMAVSVHLVRHKRFRAANTLGASLSDRERDNQAIHMLLACAGLYILTQFPSFIYNIFRLIGRYPYCYYFLSEDFVGVFEPIKDVLTSINYSANFLLYYGVSASFRQGLRDLRFSVGERLCPGSYSSGKRPIAAMASTKTTYYNGLSFHGETEDRRRRLEKEQRMERSSLESCTSAPDVD